MAISPPCCKKRCRNSAGTEKILYRVDFLAAKNYNHTGQEFFDLAQ
jgi:hypothetical protein